jgi:hypothetical protein
LNPLRPYRLLHLADELWSERDRIGADLRRIDAALAEGGEAE